MNTAIVNTTTLRNNLADTIAAIKDKKDYMLIANRGKITSVLIDIEFFEDLLALANKKYLESIKKAREEFEKGDVFTHAQVFGEV